jgi:hypothetical protein
MWLESYAKIVPQITQSRRSTTEEQNMLRSLYMLLTEPKKVIITWDWRMVSASSSKLFHCKRVVCQYKSCQGQTMLKNRWLPRCLLKDTVALDHWLEEKAVQEI